MACRKLVGQVWPISHCGCRHKADPQHQNGFTNCKNREAEKQELNSKNGFCVFRCLFLNLKYFLFFPLIWSNFDTVPKTPQVHPGGTMLMRFDFGDKDGSKSKSNLQTFDHFKDIYSAMKKIFLILSWFHTFSHFRHTSVVQISEYIEYIRPI